LTQDNSGSSMTSDVESRAMVPKPRLALKWSLVASVAAVFEVASGDSPCVVAGPDTLQR
jgi:hypothetical protein